MKRFSMVASATDRNFFIFFLGCPQGLNAWVSLSPLVSFGVKLGGSIGVEGWRGMAWLV